MGVLQTLLLGLACGVLVCCYELPDLSRRRMYKMTDRGCIINGNLYSNGDSIEVENPCLNCTCINSVQVCYLRVCSTYMPPRPGCIPVKEPNKCCPTIECGEQATSSPNNTLELRPTFKPQEETPKPGEGQLYFATDQPLFLADGNEDDQSGNTTKDEEATYLPNNTSELRSTFEPPQVTLGPDDNQLRQSASDMQPDLSGKDDQSFNAAKDKQTTSPPNSTGEQRSTFKPQQETPKPDDFQQFNTSDMPLELAVEDDHSADTTKGEQATFSPDNTLEPRLGFKPEQVTPKPYDSQLQFASDLPPFLVDGSEDDRSRNTTRGCLVNGTLYRDGSALMSNDFCLYCFCIKGKVRCVKPNCNLVISGCTPLYDSTFACCPTRFVCNYRIKVSKPPPAATISANASTDSVFSANAPAETTTFSSTTIISNDHEALVMPSPTPFSTETDPGFCITDTKNYEIGERVPDYRPCHNCYCTESGIVCQRMECGEKMSGCKPIIPEGYCCPVSYRCDNDENGYGIDFNNIHNSISPSVTKGTGIKTGVTQSTAIAIEDLDMALSEELKAVYSDPAAVYRNHVKEHLHENAKDFGIHTGVAHSAEISAKRLDKTVNATLNEKWEPVFVNSSKVPEKNEEEERVASHTPPHVDFALNDDDDEIQTISMNVKEMLSTGNYTHVRETETTLVMGINSESDQPFISDVTDNDENTMTTSKKFFSLVKNETGEEESILTGSPEVHTVEITDLLHKLFSQTANQSILSTETSFSVKRNNSKKPLSIMNDFPALEANESYDQLQANNAGEEETLYVLLPTNKSESVDKITQDMATNEFTTKQPVKDLEHITSLLTTLFPTIGNSLKSTIYTEYIEDDTSPSFEITGMKKGTEAILPFTSSINEQSEENTKLDTILFKNTTYMVRLNSKVSLGSPTESNTRSKVTTDLVGQWKDLVTKLSFSPEEANSGERETGETSTATEAVSGEIKTEETPISTEVISEEISNKTSIELTSSTFAADKEETIGNRIIVSLSSETPLYPAQPSTNNEFDLTFINKEATKGPRIQDKYTKLSTAQGYDIIPFVAQDAIRGQHIKADGSTVDSAGSFPDMVSDFCFIKGRIYTNGEMITKADPCELCRCFYGRELCQRQKCPVQPECHSEKIPEYCCPRFTCANNMTAETPAKNTVTMNSVHSSPLATPYPRLPDRITEPGVATQDKATLKYGSRVRPRPTQMYSPARSTAGQATRITDSSSVTSKYWFSTQKTNSIPSFVKDVTTKEPYVAQDIQTNSIDLGRTTYSTPDFLMTSLLRNTDASIKSSIWTTTEKPEFQFVHDPWGLLKVSGCNIYGKFFKINDQVEILSGPCSHCICTTNGVECNDIC